jgi:hypothetical protein
MIQYLLNATAIWLLSLLMYDLLLRRESFHNYNRFYLLFTMLLGALFPLVSWAGSGPLYADAAPVQQLIQARSNIERASQPAVSSVDLGYRLWIIYMIGVAINSLLLIADAARIFVLYKRGRKSREGLIIVETGKELSPFSLFNMLFVSSRERYGDAEWQMICSHEARHNQLLHFADILALQFSKIIFWFHPLIYVYNKRLLIVHEYQADVVARDSPKQYGQFLIEQSMLKSAPALSNSFNRSPIKNRIIMLTKHSSRAARIKTLVFIPLVLTCIICFAQNSNSHKKERKGDIVTFRDNQFELSKERPGDTVFMENPVTGAQEMKVTRITQYPVKVNGETIYSIEDVKERPGIANQDITLRAYLAKKLEKELSKLPDGRYDMSVSYIVTSAGGAIVYYDFDGIRSLQKTSAGPLQIPKKLADDINRKMENTLDNVKISPAKNNGRAVACLTNSGKIFPCVTPIEVKSGKATWLDHY